MLVMSMLKHYRLLVLIHKEEDQYVSECPLFNVASQGNTKKEAIANVKEALELFLEDEDVQRALPEKLPDYSDVELDIIVDVETNDKPEVAPTIRSQNY